MSFEEETSNETHSNEKGLSDGTSNAYNSDQENNSDSSSLHNLPVSELPLGHQISFLENGASDGCEWVLLYSVSSYGHYLIPKKMIPKPALKSLIDNLGAKEIPDSLTFICAFVDNEKYHRKWAPYIPLCFTYFIGEALCVHDFVEEEDPEHCREDVAFRVILQFYFTDYYMMYCPRCSISEVWKAWDCYCKWWSNNQKINLEEQMEFTKVYVDDLMLNRNVVLEKLEPALYPWDFVNRFNPFNCLKCPSIE